MFHQCGWKRTRAAVAKSRSRKGRPQCCRALPLVHPRYAPHTCAHSHTRTGGPRGVFTCRPPARILANHKPCFLLTSLVFVFCLLLPMAAKAAALWARRRAGPRNSGGGSVFSINKVCFWLGWEGGGLEEGRKIPGTERREKPQQRKAWKRGKILL